MKRIAKITVALLLAVAMCFSLAGCYDEDLNWSAKYDDTELPAGAYIYYLSIAYNEAASKVSTEDEVLKCEIDGTPAETWIKNRADEYVNQYFYIQNEMKRLGLEMTDEDYSTCLQTTESYWNYFGTSFEKFGIAKTSFDIAYSQYNRMYLKVFNALYGDVFVMPEAYIPKVGARVMSLQEPTRKMSKSDPEETYIAILDKPDVIRRKLRRAVTDSENRVLFDPENRPGVSNLMSIMGALTGRGMDDISAEYDGRGYGAFKDAVADCVISVLEPIQNEYDRISADKAYLESVMVSGRERASAIAYRTMLKVRKKVGLAALKL